MTTPAKKPSAAKKVAEGKIDHTDCYEAKLHPATTAGRSLCRTARAEGKPLTKASLQALAKKQAAARTKKQQAAKAASKPAPKAEPPAPADTDDPVDPQDYAATA